MAGPILMSRERTTVPKPPEHEHESQSTPHTTGKHSRHKRKRHENERRTLSLRFANNRLYIVARSQFPELMCRCRQKEVISQAVNGHSKFSGTLMPTNRATPIAISLIPEKFGLSQTPANTTCSHSAKVLITSNDVNGVLFTISR